MNNVINFVSAIESRTRLYNTYLDIIKGYSEKIKSGNYNDNDIMYFIGHISSMRYDRIIDKENEANIIQTLRLLLKDKK